MVTIGTVASSGSGVVRIEVSGVWVVLRSAGLLPLSPQLARTLAAMLVSAADLADRCVCVETAAGTIRNVACSQHRGGR